MKTRPGRTLVLFAFRRVPTALRSIAGSRAGRGGASFALYVLLALWTTWPLVLYPTTRLPLGTEVARTVPLFNAWTIWWNADRVLHGWNGYWDAPIFHPSKNTFAFSEPQPTTMVVAPVLWLTDSRVLAYNIYLWGSLVLNGLMAQRLLRLVGVGGAIAIGGGAAMVMLPIAHWQLGVLQLVPVWGILWTWTALLKISWMGGGTQAESSQGVIGATGRDAAASGAEKALTAAGQGGGGCAAGDAPAWKVALLRGGELGVAFAIALLTSVHHGLFLAILLAGAAWTLGRRLLTRTAWLALVAGVAVAALLTAPVVVKLYEVTSSHAFDRPPEKVARLSATPGDYTAAAGNSPVDMGGFAARPGWRLSPGLLKLALAIAGVIFGLRHPRLRWWTFFLLVTAILAFLLSLGTNLRLGPWRPWWTLTELIPGLSQVRNVFRFAYFVQVAVVLLAALGLHLLWIRSRRPGRSAAWRHGTTASLALVGLAAVADPRPSAPMLGVVPEVVDHREWIARVRDQTPPGGAIACLPMAAGNRVLDFERTTEWMFLGTYHRVAMVNGYSGFVPPAYFKIRDAVRGSGLSEEVLLRLADDGVQFLVVDRSRFSANSVREAEFASVSLQQILEDVGGVEVYRLRKKRGPAADALRPRR